jgi:DNA polymerase I-like protein with 3'-5' exonuclease and polymerase domains
MGFADSTRFAMCVPFIRRGLSDGSFESYWTPEQEAEILLWIRKTLSHPKIKVVGQNYIYDTQYIQHEMGLSPPLTHDTMLAQNVLFPGTPKDLGYLSSLYCKYHWYWKDDVKDWTAIFRRSWIIIVWIT